MKRKYSVPIAVLLLISLSYLLTSYLLTSYVSFSVASAPEHLKPGDFELVASGNNRIDLSGTVAINCISTISSDGDLYRQFKLIFSDPEDPGKQNITIYFTKPDLNSHLERGTYYITENISGFMNNFEGVFGFADIGKMGELPYFTKKGKIKISASNENNVTGRLALVLKNNLGEIVEVKGDFVAFNQTSSGLAAK